MNEVNDILARGGYGREELIRLLGARNPGEVEAIRRAARGALRRDIGDAVSFRGLVEFSNRCACDCSYCGIRAGNAELPRYAMTKDEILAAARLCVEAGYGSIVLQSGERRDAAFVDFVEDTVREIKRTTRTPSLPAGLGITLSVGEQTAETYRRFRDAGAHRYLLRIETSHRELFARLHPAGQSFDARLACLRQLRALGYQVGTGVMIGLPGQTVAMLADDVAFFREMDVDMIGMGPYLVHEHTPLAGGWEPLAAFDQALLMIAVCRLVLRGANIAAATALQAVKPEGRERGLEFGANVVMPNLTPRDYRGRYRLYAGKPCVDERPEACRACLAGRVRRLGRSVVTDAWGDAPRAAARMRRQV